MNEHPDDLLAPFALDALPEDERARVSAHVRICARCRQILEREQQVVDVLPLVAAAPAPPGLRAKILEAAAQTPQIPISVAERPTSARFGGRPSWLTRLGGWLVAAALLLISLGLGAWNLTLQQEIQALQPGPARQTVLAATSDSAGAVGSLSAHQGVGIVTVSHLPPPGAGLVYEVWIINAHGAQPAGTFVTTPDGNATFVLARPPNPGETIAITAEPTPGTSVPTGKILLKGTVSSDS